MSRKRILIITRNLPPLIGGMERLNWHIADELSRKADVHIISPAGSAALAPANVSVTEVALKPLSRFLMSSCLQAMQIASSWKPQFVLAGSGLTAPAALLASKFARARACVYLHGLDAAVQHPVYRAIWHPSIRKMDCVIANSYPTAKMASEIGIKNEEIKIVHPGVTLPTQGQTTDSLTSWRKRHSLGSARLLISIGRLTTRKGLQEFVQKSLPTIVKACPDVILAVIGDAPGDALYAKLQSRRSIQTAADAAGVGKNIRFLGVITDPGDLACAYENACLHIFPVRQINGDPEGFGMVAVEAAAHGRPTLAFATGGIIDAVAPGLSGELITPEDYDAFAQMAIEIISIGLNRWEKSSYIFAKKFAWPNFGNQISEALKIDNDIF
ncbi:glycosyltransferase family 4 protein [Comamonas sediminis]|uniref:Glycosyltransferase family 4 protein n=1 Tax=Comamonas sediminis TaxID=1783360 RepID=A0ABV4B2V3_9BURK